MKCIICDKEDHSYVKFRTTKVCRKCAASYFNEHEKGFIRKGLDLLKDEYIKNGIDGNIIDGVEVTRRVFE